MSRRREDALFSAHAILAALRSSIRILRWGMLVLMLIYLCSGITTVGPNQRGLVLRFGRALPKSAPPGLLLAFPAPIDEVVMLPAKSVQEVVLDAWAPNNDSWRDSLHPARDLYTVTGDVNIIRARFSVRFQVADPIAYEFGASERENLRNTICYQSACRVLAGMSVDDALTTRRDFIGQESMRLAQEEFDRLGLGVQLLAFETSVLQAFQDVISAKVEARTLVEPARSRHASVIPQANAEAYRIEQEAQSYAQGLIAKAQGEVSAFLALLKEYRANPGTVHTRLYAEMIEKVLPKLRVSSVLPTDRGEVRILVSPQKVDTIESNESSSNESQPLLLPPNTQYPQNIQPMEDHD
jgi:membrane protease subunit HflK